jgi:hypothetical protein
MISTELDSGIQADVPGASYTCSIGMIPTHTLRRALWLTGAWALLVVPLAGAAESTLSADFDGDGTRDRVSIDQTEPSLLHVWLSATKTTDVIRSRHPLVQVVATDLDGDHHPELIAKEASTGLSVWTRHGREGFRAFRPRQDLPSGIGRPHRKAVDDPTDPSDELPAPPIHQAPLTAARVRLPLLDRSLCRVARSSPALARAPCFSPSVPRPPPTLSA